MEEKKSEYKSDLLLKDEEILELGIKKEEIEMYRRKEYQAKFGIDTWYDQLKHHTFQTTMIEISYEESKAIINKHLKRTLSEENLNDLKILSQKIDVEIQKFNGEAFVKVINDEKKKKLLSEKKFQKTSKKFNNNKSFFVVEHKKSKGKNKDKIKIKNK